MNKIHLFNPENDLALAANSPYYTPRAAAKALHDAGELLPMWWAEDDDLILVTDIDRHADELRRMKKIYGVKGTPVTHVEQSMSKNFHPDCWGWSSYARRLFLMGGTDPSLLPDNATLEMLRQLSHRRTSISIHSLINTPKELIPTETSDVTEAFDFITRHNGSAVIKLPWSSSSRGIIYSDEVPQDTLREYLYGIIHRHGSLLIEPRYNKLQDFATLYRCADGKASFEGLSVFMSDGKSRYSGNLIMPQNKMERLIGLNLQEIKAQIEYALNQVISPHYSGWLGVDMLTYQSPSGEKLIAPCIEVNLRRTMGVAALEIERRLPAHMKDSVLLLSVTPEGIKITPSS
ncbi:MAG: hypothetical protein K2M94_03110 [Paramuribaculum sp.]|nr:hypothetical protein [Paramuribaculum sp.]